MTTLSEGKYGEDLACVYLKKIGYKIIERNFRIRGGEIDIIARDGETLVFVEVKTKIGLDFGTPEEMFGRGKYQQVKRMATLYLGGQDIPCRIDMISIILNLDNEIVSLKHYPNVTHP